MSDESKIAVTPAQLGEAVMRGANRAMEEWRRAYDSPEQAGALMMFALEHGAMYGFLLESTATCAAAQRTLIEGVELGRQTYRANNITS